VTALPQGWHVRDIFPHTLSVLVSAPGCGKGTLMTKVAADTTTGRHEIPLGSVVMVSPEDDPQTCTIHRLRASEARTELIHDFTRVGADGHQFTIGTTAQQDKLGECDDLPMLERKIIEINASAAPNVRLVVLDPLNKLAGCKLRDNQVVRNKIVEPLTQMAKRFALLDQPLAIVLVHHFTKDGKTVAGSSAIVEEPRHVLEVKRTGDLRKLRIYKSNIGRDTEDIGIDYYITGEPPHNSVRIVNSTPQSTAPKQDTKSMWRTLREAIK
jgi:predicted ATP-dependent serine protease